MKGYSNNKSQKNSSGLKEDVVISSPNFMKFQVKNKPGGLKAQLINSAKKSNKKRLFNKGSPATSKQVPVLLIKDDTCLNDRDMSGTIRGRILNQNEELFKSL